MTQTIANPLSNDLIKAIAESIFKTQQRRTFKMFKWVTEDGAYDYSDFGVRYFVVDGFAYLCANKQWVEDQEQNKRLPAWMQLPWGSYPDFPPKPAKK